ncbi:MAG: inositol monophosphatase family protein [Gammaproteobacteria bacterium]
MHPMLNIAVRAARRAGTIISRGQNRLHELKIDRKGHQDYVSQVDREAEAAIIDTLLGAYPGHAVLAEESGARGESEFEWVVDPLDGTLNYLHGYPQFAVSIALRVRGRLDQAVIYDPVRDELFTASRGAGAQLNGHRIRVGRCQHLDNALLATGFPVRRAEQLKDYLPSFASLLSQCADVRRAGAAALDLAHVACGRLDGFWEFGLKPWDIAAGALIVLESGGLVGDPAGGETHLDCGHVVASNPKLYRQLLGVLASQRTPMKRPAAGSD